MQGDIRTETGYKRADAADEEIYKLKKSVGSMVARSRGSHSALNLVPASAAVPDKEEAWKRKMKKDDEDDDDDDEKSDEDAKSIKERNCMQAAVCALYVQEGGYIS